MGRGHLNAEEIQVLQGNPYVLAVDTHRIVYTEAFKQHFMKEYLDGKRPTAIFREAGFTTEILGSKRIERCASRWREAYYAGSLGQHMDVTQYHMERLADPKLTKEEKEMLSLKQIKRKLRDKQKQIQMLQSENAALKEQLRLAESLK